MENKLYRDKLYNQIQEQYGRLVYTYTCHLKEAQIITKRLNRFKWGQIILSGLSTGGIVVIIFGKTRIGSIISGIVSVLLLIINSYLKGLDFGADANSHIQTSNELWKIREEYISLLTDFTSLPEPVIIDKRDALLLKTAEIYDAQLQTSRRAYNQAQQALKDDEEQFFTQIELNKMLPKHLRK